jgi:hypothetical protein
MRGTGIWPKRMPRPETKHRSLQAPGTSNSVSSLSSLEWLHPARSVTVAIPGAGGELD